MFFSTAHLPEKIWAIKTNLNTFKRPGIIQNVFHDHSGLKLEIKTKYLRNSQRFGNEQYL